MMVLCWWVGISWGFGDQSEQWWVEHNLSKYVLVSKPYDKTGQPRQSLGFWLNICERYIKTAWLKWEWAGHVSRVYRGLKAKIVTHWTPQGRRRRRGAVTIWSWLRGFDQRSLKPEMFERRNEAFSYSSVGHYRRLPTNNAYKLHFQHQV